jgi:trans-aconitate methyltransferase
MAKVQESARLYDHQESLEFYENRYEQGYMEEWPIERKRRISEIIRSLPLPETGEALDFGCGNGVLTDIIRQALPGWKVYGTDLSTHAVKSANQRYPDCTFFTANSEAFAGKRFDFVFTNHVFEHVFNLHEVFGYMDDYLKPQAAMLHFLPCGNPGSYEHQICLLRHDGINPQMENRFFFEDEGHVRRLTTEEFAQLSATRGFKLVKEFYSNQYYGAVNWITNSSPKFVLQFTDAARAVSPAAKRQLNQARRQLMTITVLRLPTQVIEKLGQKQNKTMKHRTILAIAKVLQVFSNPVDRHWQRQAQNEWDARQSERTGSEMCLYFKRG